MQRDVAMKLLALGPGSRDRYIAWRGAEAVAHLAGPARRPRANPPPWSGPRAETSTVALGRGVALHGLLNSARIRPGASQDILNTLTYLCRFFEC